MFEIGFGEEGELFLAGRFDASREEQAAAVLDSLKGPATVDLRRLDYISSLGLGLLLKTQKRLVSATGQGLRLVNVNAHIQDIFRFSGFHQIFDIEPTED